MSQSAAPDPDISPCHAICHTLNLLPTTKDMPELCIIIFPFPKETTVYSFMGVNTEVAPDFRAG